METLLAIVAVIGVVVAALTVGATWGRRDKESVLMALDALLQTDAIASTYMDVGKRHDATIARIGQIRSEYGSKLVRRKA